MRKGIRIIEKLLKVDRVAEEVTKLDDEKVFGPPDKRIMFTSFPLYKGILLDTFPKVLAAMHDVYDDLPLPGYGEDG